MIPSNQFFILSVCGVSFFLLSCDKQGQQRTKHAKSESAKVESSATKSEEDSSNGKIEDKEDESAAFEAEAKKLKESGAWETEQLGFYKEWAEVDPAKAADHALNHNSESSAVAAVAVVIETWIKSDRAAALEWVGGHKPSLRQSVWVSRLVENWPATELNELKTVVGQLGENTGGIMPLRRYARRWLQENPASADQLISSFLDHPSKDLNITRQIVQDWAEEAPEVASEWLSKADAAAPWRDDAIEGLALAVVDLNPDEARTWINSIQDEKRREEALARLNSPR